MSIATQNEKFHVQIPIYILRSWHRGLFVFFFSSVREGERIVLYWVVSKLSSTWIESGCTWGEEENLTHFSNVVPPHVRHGNFYLIITIIYFIIKKLVKLHAIINLRMNAMYLSKRQSWLKYKFCTSPHKSNLSSI